jgi:hypothetical protein
MKTKEQILEAIKNGKEPGDFLDRRDFSRLTIFFPVEDWKTFGFELKKGAKAPEPKELTRERVLHRLENDLEFAFEKALNCRGISSSMMYEVIKMWLWVLDDSLQDQPDEAYAYYGLPLYKAVALKYGFENPIGDDSGSEDKYEEY